jgi:hypothetical protein
MSLKSLIPSEKTKWKLDGKDQFERVDNFRFFLKMHGFLTESESRKVEQRMDRWLNMHGLHRVVH